MLFKSIFLLALLTASGQAAEKQTLTYALSQSIENIGGNDVALADVDNDKDLDIVVANGLWNRALPSKVFRNEGLGKFDIHPQLIGKAKSNSVSVADIDGNGQPDILFANGDWNNGDNSRIWWNDGLGNYRENLKFSESSNASSAALGDINGDGLLDVIMANHPYSDNAGGDDLIWINKGNRVFEKSDQVLGEPVAARRVKIIDANNDNHLDAIVLNGNAKNRLWINNGKGILSKLYADLGQGENIDFALGDINSDANPDIVIAKGAWGKQPKGIEIWLNGGNGKFIKSQAIGQNDCYGVVISDLNNDFLPDVIAVNSKDQPNQIFFNAGQGKFVDSAVDIGMGGNKVTVGDVNQDNLQDIIIVDEQNVKIYLQVDTAHLLL
ncbi:VCBS repeat protein [Alteromonadaceae bacterium 2753L.S.0a.02]|nr:VCBS repeat protein [Alteromonadaceae bacterium 2753L.S.0a.02]